MTLQSITLSSAALHGVHRWRQSLDVLHGRLCQAAIAAPAPALAQQQSSAAETSLPFVAEWALQGRAGSNVPHLPLLWPAAQPRRRDLLPFCCRADFARARIELSAARLTVLNAAHALDRVGNRAARGQIAAAKVMAPNVVLKVIDQAVQVGSVEEGVLCGTAGSSLQCASGIRQ